MKLYWPMAICEDGEQLHTYDSCLNFEKCVDQFALWEDWYRYKITKMWVDVKDTCDPEYKERIDVLF